LLGSTRAAAWPLIRDDLALTYAEVGLVLAIPGFVGSALDPLVGVIGDTARRRALMLAGGLGFALSAAVTSASMGFWTLLVALVLGNPASGAFVSLAQATLMDLEPTRRERNMVRWTLAGSFGYAAGPVLLALALWLGLGWRGVIAALAVAALPLAYGARHLPAAGSGDGQALRESVRYALASLREREVVRWVALLEAGDLLLDIFHAYLALYLVDVARVDAGAAALGVAVWTVAGLASDWLLLWVLRRMPGRRYLRASAVATLAVYPAFLIVPDYSAKLVLVALLGLLNAGWYAIPKAGLYASLPGRSGAAIAVGGIGGLFGASVPLMLGLIAGGIGLAPTMWILLLAPIALLALVPRH
jgi:FSR family fosmidomycin resistance protein-like MFS transporter